MYFDIFDSEKKIPQTLESDQDTVFEKQERYNMGDSLFELMH